MATGFIDPDSGIYIYGEDDPRQPMHAVLNLAQEATRTESMQARSRLDLLEQWLGGFNAATPWEPLNIHTVYYETGNLDPIGSVPAKPLQYRRVGDLVYFDGGVNTIAVPGNWISVGTLPPGFRPLEDTPFTYMFGHSSEINRGIAQTDGTIRLGLAPPAIGTDVTILNGQAFIA